MFTDSFVANGVVWTFTHLFCYGQVNSLTTTIAEWIEVHQATTWVLHSRRGAPSLHYTFVGQVHPGKKIYISVCRVINCRMQDKNIFDVIACS